jgi:hypothetical protein
MLGMRTAPAWARATVGAVFAIVLAVRLLSPAGFMPRFEPGAIVIVACPDSGAAVVPSGHHHGKSSKSHHPCPYASAGGIGFLTFDTAAVAALLVIGMALLLGRSFQFAEANRHRRLPPLRGPPIPA